MAAMGIEYVLDKLRWMRAEHIWPNGLRYLWMDAFGIVLLVSLYRALAKDEFLDEAVWVAADVDRGLGRPRGIRIGEEPDRDGAKAALKRRASDKQRRLAHWRW
ncbi:MAG: hypothetical protein ACLPXW_12450 [Xanthobacteraceae bacterium]